MDIPEKKTWSNRHIDDATFAAAVKAVTSYGALLRVFGIANGGQAIRNLKKRAEKLGLDTSHFLHGEYKDRRIKLSALLKIGKPLVTHQTLRKRLLAEGLLKNRCARCDGGPDWQGEQLSLVLNHKNNDKTDNRLENLELLCPNCYSLLSYSRRVNGGYKGAKVKAMKRLDQRYAKLAAELKRGF